jgi:predicted RNA-binding Zn ribbon-like protein
MSGAAPGRLEVVRRFVNTLDIEAGTDVVGTPDDLAGWLRANRLADGDGRGGLDRVRAVREALREALAANHGRAAIPDHALRVINQAADRAGLTVNFVAGRHWVCQPTAEGVDRAVGALLTVVVVAMSDGTWSRLKVCANEACRWAFYDSSRARSGRWCSMGVCGNRAKQHAWRTRHTTAP